MVASISYCLWRESSGLSSTIFAPLTWQCWRHAVSWWHIQPAQHTDSCLQGWAGISHWTWGLQDTALKGWSISGVWNAETSHILPKQISLDILPHSCSKASYTSLRCVQIFVLWFNILGLKVERIRQQFLQRKYKLCPRSFGILETRSQAAGIHPPVSFTSWCSHPLAKVKVHSLIGCTEHINPWLILLNLC